LNYKLKYFDLRVTFRRKINDFEFIFEIKTEEIFLKDYIVDLLIYRNIYFQNSRLISLIT